MKPPAFKRSVLVLVAVAAAILLSGLRPASAGEIPGKTNFTGFYPTWYFPGHRTCHGTRWRCSSDCGYRTPVRVATTCPEHRCLATNAHPRKCNRGKCSLCM